MTRKAKKSKGKGKGARLKAQIETHLEELVRLTDEARISEEMQRYLQFVALFHSYSFGNIILILSQQPGATLVAGYRKWQKMAFQVRRGETGIGILAPQSYRREAENPETGEREVETGLWFRTVYVFDVSQVGIPCLACGAMASHDATHCGECGAELDTTLPQPPQWTNEGEEGEGLTTRLRAYAQSLGIEVAERQLPGKRQGASEIGKVVLREGLSSLAQAATLAHEIAHEILHPEWERLGGLPKAVRETEAEAVAFTVCAHYGLTTVNAPNYVALWDREGKILSARLERIAGAARQIIEGLETMEQPGILLELPTAVPATEVALC